MQPKTLPTNWTTTRGRVFLESRQLPYDHPEYPGVGELRAFATDPATAEIHALNLAVEYFAWGDLRQLDLAVAAIKTIVDKYYA